MMKFPSSLFASALLVGTMPVVLAGCTHTKELGGSAEIAVIDATSLPLPDGVDGSTTVRPYRVGAGDELQIDVVGFEELRDRKISTDGEGNLSVPMAGVMNVSGLTVAEIEALVIQRMRAGYVRNPIVSVNLSEARSRRLTVDGQVARPGLYPVVGRMTLMQAVARAEGVEEFANLGDVVVFRSAGNQRYVALYNLEAIRRGAYQDPEVFPEDVIVVGESRGRRLFQTILQAGGLLAGPIIALIQR